MLRSSLIIAAVCLALAACSSTDKADAPTTQAASMGVLNDECPVMGEAVDPKVTTEYHGATIGFCCAGCIGKWDDMSDADKDAFVAKYTGK